MRLFISDIPLVWGELDLPMLGIDTDWSGAQLTPPLAFSLASDPEHLWFIATREAPASIIPLASPGAFIPGLWQSDTAELFIADPSSGEYVEFNLAPNGAWWAASFSSVRTLAAIQPDFENHVSSYHEAGGKAYWISAMAISLKFLESQIRFNPGSTANAAFILNSPAQTFHSGTRLPGEEPDFHQPSHFVALRHCKLPSH